jgi:hypothetical protein
VTSTGLTLGEIDFARDESHWWSEDSAPAGPSAIINVGGRCYWSTREGWREIQAPGEERNPGIGYLSEIFTPLIDAAWSIHRVSLLDEDCEPRAFVAIGEVATRTVSISAYLDDDRRITRLDAQYAPLINPDDDDAIAPGYCASYQLYDFGAAVSMPQAPPDAEIVDLPA